MPELGVRDQHPVDEHARPDPGPEGHADHHPAAPTADTPRHLGQAGGIGEITLSGLDISYNFGGGTVQLRTKRVPEAAFLEVEAKLGYNDQTTGKDGLTYAGGSKDWTGFDDGTREMSDLLMAATADGTEVREFNRFTGVGYTREELEAIGESLPVNYAVNAVSVDPNVGFGLAGGNRLDVTDGFTLGFLAAMDYDNKWATTQQQRTDYVVGSDELVPENDYVYDITVRNIDFSGFVTLGAELGDNHGLTWNWMLLRSTTDRTQRQQGFNKDAEGGDVQFTELEWLERQLESSQLIGEHVFTDLWGLELDWNYTTARAETEEPDTRTYRYDPDTLTPEDDDLIFSLRNDSNQRRWSELEDNSDSWNVDLVQPFPFGSRMEFDLRVGFSSVERERDSGVRRFAFRSRGPISGDVDLRRNLNPDDVIYDETIDPRGWQLGEVTIATDAYSADQTIDSSYFAVNWGLDDWLRLGGGFRNERSSQSVTTFDQFSPDRNPI